MGCPFLFAAQGIGRVDYKELMHLHGNPRASLKIFLAAAAMQISAVRHDELKAATSSEGRKGMLHSICSD
jgi:hypothetical protein